MYETARPIFLFFDNNLTTYCAVCLVPSTLLQTKQHKMKKAIFTAMVVLGSMSAFAQFDQGTKLVGGQFGLEFSTEKSKLNNQTDTDGKWTSFSFEPRFGYFVINNLAIGGELGVTSYTWKPEGADGKSTGTELTIGPFARYYFEPGIFVEGKYTVGTQKTKQDYFGDTEEEKAALSNFALGAGYALFLNDNVALEPMIGFQSSSAKNKTTGEPEVKSISSGLFLRVGFQVYLR
jgi:hypothetical protein